VLALAACLLFSYFLSVIFSSHLLNIAVHWILGSVPWAGQNAYIIIYNNSRLEMRISGQSRLPREMLSHLLTPKDKQGEREKERD
jgi:hypothetical protein